MKLTSCISWSERTVHSVPRDWRHHLKERNLGNVTLAKEIVRNMLTVYAKYTTKSIFISPHIWNPTSSPVRYFTFLLRHSFLSTGHHLEITQLRDTLLLVCMPRRLVLLRDSKIISSATLCIWTLCRALICYKHSNDCVCVWKKTETFGHIENCSEHWL